MHWRKKCNMLSHTAHLKHHSLLKWKFVVIHAASMGEAEPWESFTVNTSLNGPTVLMPACDPSRDSQKQQTQTKYLHAPSVVFTLAFTSAMQTSGYFHPSFTSEFRHVKATTVLEAILNGGRKQKNGFHLWRRRRGACFIDMAGKLKGETRAKMRAG